jgi:hypothetical protein
MVVELQTEPERHGSVYVLFHEAAKQMIYFDHLYTSLQVQYNLYAKGTEFDPKHHQFFFPE